MLFPTACTIAAIWLTAAIVTARRRSAPVLWGRAALILTAAYCYGAIAGWWPWTAASPALNPLAHWLGG